jgi:hypothetical protein
LDLDIFLPFQYAFPYVQVLKKVNPRIAIAKLKKYKSSGSDQIPAEVIQVGGEMLLSAIHNLINSVWNKEELPDQWKESIIVPIHKKGDKTDCNKYRGISLLATSYKMREKRNAYRLLVGKPEGKRPIRRPRRRWLDNIRMDLVVVGWSDADWIGLAQDRTGGELL